MRVFLTMLLLLIVPVLASGCGDKRPDPRANPEFDKAAVDTERASKKVDL